MPPNECGHIQLALQGRSAEAWVTIKDISILRPSHCLCDVGLESIMGDQEARSNPYCVPGGSLAIVLRTCLLPATASLFDYILHTTT